MTHTRLWRWLLTYKHPLVLGMCFLLAIVLRGSVIELRTNDYRYYLKGWHDFIERQGGVPALAFSFYDYTPAYIYLLVIAYYVIGAVPKVIEIKLISIVFDLVCAYWGYKLVRLKYPRGAAPWYAAAAILLAPTVVANSSAWGQSDSIYTAALLGCIYCLMVRRQTLGCVLWGLAFTLKPQAIFLLPLMLILLVRGYVRWSAFISVPLMFGLSLLPAWALGRPLAEVWNTLFAEGGNFRYLSGNAPNLYLWLPNKHFDTLYPLVLGFAVICVCGLVGWAAWRRLALTPETIVRLAAVSLLLMPFVLPKMRERYFFPADVFTIILAGYFPRYIFVPTLVSLASLLSYIPYLFQTSLVPLRLLSFVMLAALAAVLWLLRTAPREAAASSPPLSSD